MKSKHIHLLIGCLMLTASVFCQTQQGFKWQGLAKDAAGNAVTQPVTLTFTILQNATLVYVEIHSPITPNAGQLIATVGAGTATQGTFTSIDWSAGSHTLNVKMKIGNGAIVDMGSSQILPVPIALWAQNSGASGTSSQVLGPVTIAGYNEGAVKVNSLFYLNQDWVWVTRTCNNPFEDFFALTPIPNGMSREYFLGIRKADSPNNCIVESDWRFYFEDINKSGHTFKVQLDYGNLQSGGFQWVKVPSIEQQNAAMGLSPDGLNTHWRLEVYAPYNNNCQFEMNIFEIVVMAIDKQNGSLPQILLSSNNAPGGEPDFILGSPSMTEVSINHISSTEVNSLRVHKGIFTESLGAKYITAGSLTSGLIEADVSGLSGSAGRDAISIVASSDNTSGTILVNKPRLTFWSTSNNAPAKIESGDAKVDDLQINGEAIVEDGLIVNGGAYIGEDLNVEGWITTKVLEITGGDVAEARHSTTGEQLPPGSVVVFDEKEKGKIRLTSKAYDKQVAGVISGAGNYFAGVCLLQEELSKGAMPVAQIGTVEVLAIGPIAVGDLLTTSTQPGYAMRAKNRRKSFGAVIGKTTTTLGAGERGLVEIQVEKH